MSDSVPGVLFQAKLSSLSKSTTIPICKYAIGDFLTTAAATSKQNRGDITPMPPWYGYLRDKNVLNRKNWGRFINSFCSLTKKDTSIDLVNVCFDSFKCERIRLEHLDANHTLVQGTPCKVCFRGGGGNTPACPVNAIASAASSNNHVDIAPMAPSELIRSSVRDIYQKLVFRGLPFKEIHDLVCDISYMVGSQSFPITESEDKTLFVDYRKECETKDAIIESVKINVGRIAAHVDSTAVQLHYASDLSRPQLATLDRLLFCEDRHKTPIEDKIKDLPKLRTVVKNNPHLKPELMFEKYITSLREQKAEPSFLQLAKDFKLDTSSNGQSIADSTRTRSAQSICWNILLQPSNSSVYEQVIPLIRNKNYERFKPYPIMEGVSMPRLPSFKVADEQVKKLHDDGLILLGHSHEPQSHSRWNIIDCCEESFKVITHVINFVDIAKHSLQFQDDRSLLRGQKPEYYADLPILEVKQRLIDYRLISYTYDSRSSECITPYNEGFLREKLRLAETTRIFTVWYDHAVLLKRGYIMFTISPTYLPQLYHSTEHDVRTLQKIIERPYLHIIGISPSTTAAEESFRDIRLAQMLSLTNKLTARSSGVEFSSNLRFIIGDTPVRNSEYGQNKSGPYRLSHVQQGFPVSHLSYAKLKGLDHMDFKDKAAFANVKGYFEDPANTGKNLQDEIHKRPLQTANWFGGRAQKAKLLSEKTKIMENLTKGCRKPPLLMNDNPNRSLEDYNAPLLEVVSHEPLHDIKGIAKMSIDNVPGVSKQGHTPLQKALSDITSCYRNDDFKSKDNKSAEDYQLVLFEVVQKLIILLFPSYKEDGDRLFCRNCQVDIFTMSPKPLCEKCLYLTYYLALLEISIYGYKDESKRNGKAALRLHNLIFIFFKCTQELQKIDPGIEEVTKRVYFFNIVYYMAIFFELQSPLSYNAGRLEDLFKQMKQIALSGTNRHHFTEEFLLRIVKIISCKQLFKQLDGPKHSRVSKAATKFFQNTPMLEIRFSSLYLADDPGANDARVTINARQDFMFHLRMISNYVVSNEYLRYMKVIDNDNDKTWKLCFPVYQDCYCSENTCVNCQAVLFPPFDIHNAFHSTIKLILGTKKTLFEESVLTYLPSDACPEMFHSQLKKLLKQESQLHETVSSTSHIELTLAGILNNLPHSPEGFEILKFSPSVQCVAKLCNEVSPFLISLDKASNTVATHPRVTDPVGCSHVDIVNYHRAVKRYDALTTQCITLLKSRILDMDKEVTLLTAESELDGAVNEFNSIQLQRYNKRRGFLVFVRERFEFELANRDTF